MVNITDKVGTNETNIASNTSAIADAGGAWEFVSSTTASSDTSVTLSLTGDASYTAFLVVFTQLIPSVNNKPLYLKMLDNSSTQVSFYKGGGVEYCSVSSVAGFMSDRGSSWYSENISNDTGSREYGASGHVFIQNALGTSGATSGSGSTTVRWNVVGYDDNTPGRLRERYLVGTTENDTVNKVQLYFDAANITSGTFYVYRLVQS